MIKLNHLRNLLKKINLLLFIILLLSHLTLKCLKLAIIWLQPLLMIYLQGFIIVTNFFILAVRTLQFPYLNYGIRLNKRF